MGKRKGIKFNPSHGVSIEDSLITSNHLIVYKGKVFDSALEYDDIALQ